MTRKDGPAERSGSRNGSQGIKPPQGGSALGKPAKGPDLQATLNRLETLKGIAQIFQRTVEQVRNVSSSRQDWMNSQTDPRRDVYSEVGVPLAQEAITAQACQHLYEREAIAARVVEVYPNACWQVSPYVYESEDPNVVTPFEAAWDQMIRNLRGEHCWFQDDQGSELWEKCKRVDKLSRIGHYGVFLLGLNDGLPLSQPVAGVVERNSMPANVEQLKALNQRAKEAGEKGSPVPRVKPYRLIANLYRPDDEGQVDDPLPGEKEGAIEQQDEDSQGPEPEEGRSQSMKLLYLRVFPETQALVTRWETNWSSPRFMQPVEYQITFNDPTGSLGGIGAPTGTRNVHWTRIVHIPGANKESSEVCAAPEMRPVYNNLMGLQKIYNSSPEGYWQGAKPILSLEADPSLGGDVDIDMEEAKDQVEQLINSMQGYLINLGLTAKMIAPTVVDPNPSIEAQLKAIAICKNMPMRIFMGSERGELASSQDDAAWNDTVKMVEQTRCTPDIVVPLTDRLIFVGVLPVPEGFSVEWPDITSQSDQERATVASTVVQALATYVSGGVNAVLPEQELFVELLGWDEDRVHDMMVRMSAIAEAGGDPAGSGSPLLGLVGGIGAMMELFKMGKEGVLSPEQLQQQIALFFTKGDEAAAADLITEEGMVAPLAPAPTATPAEPSPEGLVP